MRIFFLFRSINAFEVPSLSPQDALWKEFLKWYDYYYTTIDKDFKDKDIVFLLLRYYFYWIIPMVLYIFNAYANTHYVDTLIRIAHLDGKENH